MRGRALGAAPYALADFYDDRHFAVFHFKTTADAETFYAGFREDHNHVN